MDDNFETKFKSFEERISKLLPTIAVILIAIWWVFYGMVEIIPTELTITDRIGLTVCTSVIAICYSSLIGEGGFQSAKNTDKYKAAREKWYESTKKALGFKKEVNAYAESIAKTNRIEVRTKILESVGLKYKDVFDENDNLKLIRYRHNRYHKIKNPDGFYKEQVKAISRCVRIHLFVPDVLAASIEAEKFGIKKQVDEDTYKRTKITIRTAIKLITSIFATGIMFAWLGITASAIIYALFQIVLWTGTGVSERMSNYNFVINKIVPQIVDNTLIIDSFLETKKDQTNGL